MVPPPPLAGHPPQAPPFFSPQPPTFHRQPPQFPFNQSPFPGFPVNTPPVVNQPPAFPPPPPRPSYLQPIPPTRNPAAPFFPLQHNPSLVPAFPAASGQATPYPVSLPPPPQNSLQFNDSNSQIPTHFNQKRNRFTNTQSHRQTAPSHCPSQSARSYAISTTPGQNQSVAPHPVPANLPPGPGPPVASQNFAQQQQYIGYFPEQPPCMYSAVSGTAKSCDPNGTAVGFPVMGFPVHGEGVYPNGTSAFLHQQPAQQLQYVHQESVTWQAGAVAPQCQQSVDGPAIFQPNSNLKTFPTENCESDKLHYKANGQRTRCEPNSVGSNRKQPKFWSDHSKRCNTGYSEISTQQDSFPSQGWNRTQLQQSSHGLNRDRPLASGVSFPNREIQHSLHSYHGGFHRSPLRHSKGNGEGRSFPRRPGQAGTGWGAVRGRHSGIPMKDRSEKLSLRCDPCDRTFKNATQKEAHITAHIKCDEEGCSYEASGKLIKEHKVTEHGKISAPTRAVALRAITLRSKESQEEIKRWREERKRNYPTTTNIQRKAEESKARKARGELVDEDAQKRRQRLREILARQAELGLPVAEVPAHYISDRFNSWRGQKRDKRNHNNGTSHLVGVKRLRSCDDRDTEILKDPKVSKFLEGSLQEAAVNERNGGSEDASGQLKQNICHFFQRGVCKDGSRCEFLHERRGRKRRNVSKNANGRSPSPERAPTLLSKLLESDIRRDKSHLLQCFRFMVNNSFFCEWPNEPLKFFEWVESSDSGSGGEIPTDGVQVRLSSKIRELADGAELSINIGEGKMEEAPPTKPESYNMREKLSDIEGCEKGELTKSPDLWEELQQRLLEDAGSISTLRNGCYGQTSVPQHA